MSEKKKLIPELRFPEFADDGEWEEKTLDEVGTFSKGKGISKADIVEKGNLPCIRYGELYTHYNETISIIKSSTNLKAEDLVLSQANDVIIPASGETQIDIATASCVLKNGIALGGDLNIIRSKINGVFLSYFLNNAKKKEIAKMAQGISVIHLYSNQLKTLKIQIPKNTEQKKIASFLTSLDEIITAHSKKLDSLKDHKKGLMQNLFPQEGEKVPKYRFKEFVDDGEWQECTLENLTTKIGDGIHTTPTYNTDGEYYFINGNNLIDGKIWVDEKSKRVSEEEYHKHKRDLNESTILLSINGTIGNIAIYNNERVILGKSACYINVDETTVNKNFIIYFIQADETKSYFHHELTGSTIKNLSLKSIRETIIKVPVNPKEQQKIASCLSSLDALIMAQTEKIEQLKLHKKGLMQKLFPKKND